jgi:hypothetical protein
MENNSNNIYLYAVNLLLSFWLNIQEHLVQNFYICS